MDELDHVGTRLRVTRNARGWTLDELASRAGMSPSTLSRLESGKRQATLELLLPLTRQLGIKIDDLVRSETPDPRVRRPMIRSDGMLITPMTAEASPVLAFRIVYAPRAETPEPKVHEGYEWLYVLSGRLHLRLGTRDLVLARGEAAEFDTLVPHAMWASGKPAEVLSIFNQSGARIHTHTSDETD